MRALTPRTKPPSPRSGNGCSAMTRWHKKARRQHDDGNPHRPIGAAHRRDGAASGEIRTGRRADHRQHTRSRPRSIEPHLFGDILPSRCDQMPANPGRIAGTRSRLATQARTFLGETIRALPALNDARFKGRTMKFKSAIMIGTKETARRQDYDPDTGPHRPLELARSAAIVNIIQPPAHSYTPIVQRITVAALIGRC